MSTHRWLSVFLNRQVGPKEDRLELSTKKTARTKWHKICIFDYDDTFKRRGKMRNVKISLGVIFIVSLLLPQSGLPKSLYKFVYSPRSDIYFGQISLVDVKYDGHDAVVLREGESTPEIAVLNLPLTAGDTIRTTERKCELRFDTGTSIRLDFDTELKLETILAQSLSSRNKLTNLVLQRGQVYVLYRKHDSLEVFQVITPQTAVKMKDRTVASVRASDDGNTDIRVKSGEVYVLYGPDADSLKTEKIRKTQKGIITEDQRFLFSQEHQTDPDLSLWSESAEIYLRAFPESGGFVPITLRKYREPVSYFVKRFSDLHGEWMWHRYYGYVWRPEANDDYPDGSWQPYLFGQWRELEGLLFWVPEEEWGWVPHHLGLWMWDNTHGWLWIPGLDFAPAWVAWDYFWGFYAWRPWALWDWYSPYFYYDSYYSRYFSDYLYRPAGVPEADQAEEKKERTILRVIKKDQLKKKAGTQFTLPKELESAYKKTVAALKKEDQNIMGSLEKLQEQVILVASQDLNDRRIQERRITTEQMTKQLESPKQLEQVFPLNYPEEPHQKAVWSFRRNKEIVDIRKHILSSFTIQTERAFSKKFMEAVPEKKAVSLPGTATGKEGTAVLSPRFSRLETRATKRIFDWNPDLKIARRMGVHITYSSRNNEVRCPDLGLNSKNVAVSRDNLTSRGFYFSSGGGDSGSSSSGSSEESTASAPERGSSGEKIIKSTAKSGAKVKK